MGHCVRSAAARNDLRTEAGQRQNQQAEGVTIGECSDNLLATKTGRIGTAYIGLHTRLRLPQRALFGTYFELQARSNQCGTPS